jgi:hypothetical protein
MPRTLIAAIASTVAARSNCLTGLGNKEWLQRWTDRLENIERELLPRGSGIDSGTIVHLEKSTADRIVFRVPFHCMDPNGFYCGWRDYTVTVTPSFDGFNVRVTGRDYNGLKDYLADLFRETLSRPFDDATA